MSNNDPFAKFVEIIAALRHPVTGCPWDLEQTHRSIRPYLIEEAYEVLDAIDADSDTALKEELGDLLLQVVLHSQIATDRKAFSIDEVVRGVSEKMVRRHPHVFGDTKVTGSAQVLTNWEQIKSEEKSKLGDKQAEARTSLLDGVPKQMPQLTRAQRIGEKASRVGFEWEALEGVLAKVDEELSELKAEIQENEIPPHALTTAPKSRPAEAQLRLEEEFGDLLFSVTQLGRWLGVGAEDSLRGTIEKFSSRFRWMEENAPKPLKDCSPGELDSLWTEAKMLKRRPGARR